MKTLLGLCLMALVTTASGQTGYRQKVYPFFQKISDGTSRHFIYIQMAHDSIPIWDSAIIDNKKYTVHFSPVEDNPLQVGERKSDNRMVKIKPAPDTKMYVADFSATGISAQPNAAGVNASVIFWGIFKGHRLTYKILTETEIN